MAGRRAGSPVAVKLVGVFPGNVELGLEPHPAVICLFDATTGRALALDGRRGDHGAAHGGRLRGVGAGAGPGGRARARGGRLGRPGAGPPADAAARAAVRRRPARRARSRRRCAARRRRRARSRAPTSSASARRPPRPCCRRVAPGRHVTSVGFAPPGGELDPALAASSRLFVETLQAFEAPPAGLCRARGLDPSVGTELGYVLLGQAPGRVSPGRGHGLQGDGAHRRGRGGRRARVPRGAQAGVGRDVDV